MVKTISWNANGLKATEKHDFLLYLCGLFDVVCVQETHTLPSDETSLFSPTVPYSTFWSHLSPSSCGVLTVVSHRSGITVKSHDNTNPNLDTGRFVKLTLSLPNSDTFDLLNIYAPAHSDKARAQFFSSLPVSSCDTIIVGDFNMVMSPLDKNSRSQGASTSPHAAAALSNLTSTFDLHDAWRLSNPEKIAHTYHKGGYSARLDRFLIPSSLLHSAVSDIALSSISDHSPASLTINNLSNIKPGHDRFCNTALFSHKVFRANFLVFLKKLIYNHDHPNFTPSDFWEWLKRQINSYIRIAAPIYAAERHKNLNILRARAAEYDTLLHANPSDSSLQLDQKNALAALEEEELYLLTGHAIRSQYFHRFVRERVPKHIAKLEKHKSNNKFIPSLRINATTTSSDTNQMLNHARDFWGKLFHAPEFGPHRRSNPKARDYFLHRYANKTNPLTPALLQLLAAPITLEEISNIVRKLPTHRSNGPDGLPYEFYSDPEFWDLVGPSFLNMLIYSLDKGILPQ